MNRGPAALPLAAAVIAALLGFACTPSPTASPSATASAANPAPAGQGAIVTIGPAAAPTTAASGTAGLTIQIRDDAKLGKILADAEGKALYRYDQDRTEVSSCTGGCTQTWQPLLLPSGDPTGPSDLQGQVSTFSRPDGGRQVMYNNAPLYRFIGDTQPNDAKGDSPNGPWHVVHLAGS